MAHVPGGAFWMGSNADGTQCPGNALDLLAGPGELPCHPVTVPGFLMDKTEVTVWDYGLCASQSPGTCTAPSSPRPNLCNWERDDPYQPMNCLTWAQMDAYCRWAGKRLCSESEWELGARGGDGRLYPWGNQAASCTYAVMGQEGSDCGDGWTMPVGSKPAGASPFGAMDLAGNLAEWVADDHHGSYAGAPADGTPWVDEPRGASRVLRGGSIFPDSSLRAASRSSQDAAYFFADIGGRCCKSLAP